jgi:hypothetical protein
MSRPRIITFICIIGYLSVVFTFPQVFSPAIKKLGVLMPAIYGILVAAFFIACVGIWYFKQWGVQLYLTVFFAKVLFNLYINESGPGFAINTALTLVFSLILLRFYRRMSPNL